jgi:hypothetical protein
MPLPQARDYCYTKKLKKNSNPKTLLHWVIGVFDILGKN